MGRDDRDQYRWAGKGARQRERLTLADIPRRIGKSRPQPRPETRTVKRPERDEEGISGRDVKQRIRRLLLDHDMSCADICATLERDGHSVTPITVSRFRTEMQEVLRMLQRPDIALLDPDDLARYRRKRSR